MTELSLFMVVFSLQIILLSAYFPWRVLKRSAYVLENYPASTHPKLYPKSSEFFTRNMNIYRWLNGINFILGWVILYFIYTGQWVGEEGVHPLLPWGYFMWQMIPSQLLEVFGMRLAKLMKQQDQRTIKTAQLTPRGILDYVSPHLLSLVPLTFLAFMILGLIIENQTLNSSTKTLSMCGVLVVGFVFFYAMSKWLIGGKVKDPYQSNDDRHKTVSMVIKSFCYTLIACHVFMMLALMVEAYQLKSVMPIMMSLFLQMLVIISMGFMLNNNCLKDMDFDVYKANPTNG